MKPSVSLSEEYNDNVLLEPGNGTEDSITHVVPALQLRYGTSFWTWDVDYALDYRHFEKRTAPDDAAHTLKLKNRTEALDDVFFIDITEDISRVSLNVERDYTQQSLVVNQAERNVFTVDPFVILRPSKTAVLAAGYRYGVTKYTRVAETTEGAVLDRTDGTAYGEAAWSVTSRLSITAGYGDRKNRNDVENYELTDIYAGARYEYGEKSFIHVRADNGAVSYERTATRRLWMGTAGISHDFTAARASLDWERSLLDDPLTVSTLLDASTAAVNFETPRSDISLGATRNIYRDARSDVATARGVDLRGAFTRRLSGRATGTVSCFYQDLEDRTPAEPAHTRTQIYGARFRRSLARDMTLSVDYSFIKAESPLTASNNYTNNRAVIGLTKEF